MRGRLAPIAALIAAALVTPATWAKPFHTSDTSLTASPSSLPIPSPPTVEDEENDALEWCFYGRKENDDTTASREFIEAWREVWAQEEQKQTDQGELQNYNTISYVRT